MDQARIGIAGAGFITRKHLPPLTSFDDVRIVAIADPATARAEELAAGIGAAVYADPLAMLAAETVDAVYVCVPPFAHGPLEDELLQRRLPFFVEKPLDIDLGVAERTAAGVAELGLITAVGYHWRYRDTVERAKALLAEHPPRQVMGYWLGSTPGAGWWTSEEGSGGQMVEQTTHLFDLARHLVGEVVEVYAVGSRIDRAGYPNSTVLDSSTAVLRFASGAVGSISSTCLLENRHRIGMTFSGERLLVDVTEKDFTVDNGEELVQRPAVVDPFLREDRDFIDAVKGGENRIRVPYAEALKTHRLAVAAARSARDGAPIRLPA